MGPLALIPRLSVLLLLPMLVLAVPPAQGAQATSSSSPMAVLRHGSLYSTNWSGYAVNGSAGSVSAAQATWKVPAVTCPSSGNLYSSFWVGIDGFQSSTVEQTGTDSDCRNGVPTYYAWYEFFPQVSHTISGFTVRPGDIIGARVWYTAGAFSVAVKDFNTSQTYKTTSSVSGAARSSAEFIVEAPVVCTLFRCHLASLSNFGTADFGADYTNVQASCALTMGGTSGLLGDFGSSVQKITMVSQSSTSTLKALPSSLSPDGSSFTVQWLSAGP